MTKPSIQGLHTGTQELPATYLTARTNANGDQVFGLNCGNMPQMAETEHLQQSAELYRRQFLDTCREDYDSCDKKTRYYAPVYLCDRDEWGELLVAEKGHRPYHTFGTRTVPVHPDLIDSPGFLTIKLDPDNDDRFEPLPR